MKALLKIRHKREVINEFAANSFRFGWAGTIGAVGILFARRDFEVWNFPLIFEYVLMLAACASVDLMAFRSKRSVQAGGGGAWLALNLGLRLVFYSVLSLILCFQLRNFGLLNWGGLFAICVLGMGVESIVANSSSWPLATGIFIFSFTFLPVINIFLSQTAGAKEFSLFCVAYLLLQIPKSKTRHRAFVESAEVKLKLEAERSFNREILDSVPDPIFTKDEKHKWIFANRAFCSMLGKPLEEIVGRSDYDFFPKEMADGYWEKDNQVLNSRIANENEEYVTDVSGRRLTVLTKKKPVQLSNGILALIGVIRDITDRKQLEKSNQILAKRLDLLAKSSHMAVWYARARERTFEATDEFYDISGFDNIKNTDEIQSQFLKYIDADFIPAYQENLKTFRSGGADSFFMDCPYRSRNRGPIWLRMFLTIEERDPVTKLPVSVIGYLQDVSQVKRMEERLQAQSRLTALGEMASGIAHEINNPLMIISGRMNMLMRDLRADLDANSSKVSAEKKIESVEKVLATVDRITKIVRGLRFFSRSEEKEPFETVDIEDVIQNTLAICEEHFRHSGIDLSVQLLPKGQLKIDCRSTQISQVLINLLNNAFDALSAYENALEHAFNPALKKWVHLHCEEVGSRVRISITDSGPGIPENIARKLMQPFFTTKEVGKGTGLGLSISKGIVEDHGGRIWLDREHKNTRFVFEIPLQQVPDLPLS